jgi:hypothetical protein
MRFTVRRKIRRKLCEFYSEKPPSVSLVLIKCSLVYVSSITSYVKESRPIPWTRIVSSLSPVPGRTVVYDYRHELSAKDPFGKLLWHGAYLFVELFDVWLPKIRIKEVSSSSHP